MSKILCAISLGKKPKLGEICLVLVRDTLDNKVFWTFAFGKKIDNINYKYHVIDKNSDYGLLQKIIEVLTPQDWIDITKITKKFETINEI